MLDNPKILLLNCLGSYFYSILHHISNPELNHSLLYYLADGNIIYEKLNIENVKEKFGDNAWGFQPISIVDQSIQPLKINQKFFQHLLDEYKIKVNFINMNNNLNWLDIFIPCKNTKTYFICSVDEYYLSSSIMFFGKQHNKHFLLVRHFNVAEGTIEVIDSEHIKPYIISCEELMRAVCKSIFSNKIIYQIDCRNFLDLKSSNKFFQRFVTYRKENESETFIHFKEDISLRLSTEKNIEYLFKGYYYTIISKIYPYTKMISYVLYDSNLDFYKLAFDIAYEWKVLSNFMLYKMQKKDVNSIPLIKKIDSIIIKQKELDRLIKNDFLVQPIVNYDEKII